VIWTHPSTGLPSRSRDTAGVETVFTYDSMGRPLTVDPSSDLMTTYTYRLATSTSSLARVTVARVTSPGAVAAAESRVDFDAFGRPVKEEQRMPDSSWKGRQTTYNALGWKTFVSEQGSPYGTSFPTFDAFGRQGRTFKDTQNETTVHVRGGKVVITSKDGAVVTQFKITKSGIARRIASGQWVPVK
jgi:hypothetical protein